MSGFTSRSACRGHRPSSLVSYDGFQRSALVGRLLKERGVARFIVAPDGYGKTSVALEYAETMFSWDHTFWFSAQSPCFIRDLDAGEIASACMAVDEDAALIVIDDLPPLDVQRLDKLSSEIDELLDRGVEVIVTCVPSCDVLQGFQRDRIRVSSRDLLLSDDELDASRSAEDRMRQAASEIPDAQRVAALVWGKGDDSVDLFAKKALSEEIPSDLLLAFASMMVLQRGAFDSLRSLGVADSCLSEDVAEDYPHLGLDSETESFDAAMLDISSVAGAVRKRVESMVIRSVFEKPEGLIVAWADNLLAGGFAARACDVMRLMCPRAYRAPWLVENSYELVRHACFYPSLQLARDQKGLSGPTKAKMLSFEALCRCILGDDEGAVKAAKRCAFDQSAPMDARVCSAIIVSRLGRDAVLDQARAFLEETGESVSASGADAAFWRSLAQAWCAGAAGPLALSELWCAFKDADEPHDLLCICASWLFGLMGTDDEQPGSAVVTLGPSQRIIERYVRERLAEDGSQLTDYFAASAGLALEEAHERGASFSEGPLEAAVVFRLRRVEVEVLSQRGRFDKQTRATRAKRQSWMSTRPDSYLGAQAGLASGVVSQSVPTLTLRLFGCFEVSIGDVHVEQKCFKRQNIRALLVLLAVNQGKEISREQLARAMWPNSAEEVGRKNFYTVWAQLRKILSLPDGTCPYLVRHQYGCSLEQRYVNSDVERFSDICRDLLFGKPDVERWSELFAEVDRDFSSDLMPSERHNQLVIQARNDYRSRLVDALVSATYSILEIGYPQWGIWFSRSAIKHDETREDAYVALMRAQVAGNQRTAAMMTFLKCRRVLDEQLGIDPSPEANALYASLLEGR